MKRNSKAISLIECVAAISVMTPIMVGCCMAIQEVSQAYQIKQGLAQAARQAACDMSAVYLQSPLVDNNRAIQNSFVYGKITVPGVVTHQSQFDNAVFDVAANPRLVSVTVHYRSDGNTNLAVFPSVDPLKLGSNIDLNATATYSLD